MWVPARAETAMCEDEERGFKVADRRRFDAQGDPRAEAGPDEARAEAPEDVTLDGGTQPPADGELPAIDFSTFALSLCTSAMVHLGQAPHPDGATATDLPLARQTIDILALLRDKTEGNLTDDERRLLDEMLYDLRLRFVAAQR